MRIQNAELRRGRRFPGRTYLVRRKEIEIVNVADKPVWEKAFGKVFQETQASGRTITGPAAALYFSWDEASGTTELGIGVPVDEAGDISDPDLSLASVPESAASMVTVRGSYDGLRDAHGAMSKYVTENGLSPTLTIEEYEITDQETLKTEDWRTNLYYLHG